jgi:hypothetical protein
LCCYEFSPLNPPNATEFSCITLLPCAFEYTACGTASAVGVESGHHSHIKYSVPAESANPLNDGVGVTVGVGVFVGVLVNVGVLVAVTLGVTVFVGVTVGVLVNVGVTVGV